MLTGEKKQTKEISNKGNSEHIMYGTLYLEKN